jgi:hypothetical protein
MGIKLEVGKRYVSRRDGVYGPLFAVDGIRYLFECRARNECWTENGCYYSDGDESSADLIALAPDEAPEPDELATIRAENARLREALEKIAKNSTDETNPNLSSQDSFGNADDVFYDGMRQGDYYTAEIARTALAQKEPK